MPRSVIVAVLAPVTAAALVVSVGPMAAAAEPPPPDTLTKAAYHQSNGNVGTITLNKGGKNTPAVVPGKDDIVVSLGDSYISGEAGRWAGNASGPNWAKYADALGSTAYGDNNGVEALPDCHRSQSAEIHFGAGVTSVNLACSGATTKTDASEIPFKPGIDFTDTTVGKDRVTAMGQALLLQNLAVSNPGRIKMIVLSIGGNDFSFADIVAACVTTYLKGYSAYCKDEKSVTDNFTAANIAKKRAAIGQAMANVVTAMTRAGYKPSQWTLLVQTYPSPVATSKTIVWPQNYLRQFVGGCGLYNKDLDWANKTALGTINETVRYAVQDTQATQGAPAVKVLDLSNALVGHRLCETGTTIVGKWPPLGNWSVVRNWQQDKAVDLSEWVAQIRVTAKIDEDLIAPYRLQESLHPNYWAQLAYRSCLRQAYKQGAVRGGDCIYAGTGLDKDGLPKMELDPNDGWDDATGHPGLRGAKGAPTGVKKLKVRVKDDGVVHVRWRKPGKAAVRIFMYKVKRHGERSAGWLSAGESRKLHLVLHKNGKYKIKVLAENEHGASRADKQRFRVDSALRSAP